MKESALYSIGAVARMVGVPPATLRTWEERYGVLVPTRSPGGQRLYSRDQIAQLRFLKDRLAQGIAPADAHRLLAEQMTTGAVPVATEASVRLLILLAERDQHAAALSEYFLRTEGYDVAVVLDAAEAVRRFQQLTPSLIVVDLLISDGSGLELCRQLKEQRDVPVLAISSLETADDALNAGSDAFLQKPLDPLELVSVIKDLLGTSAFLRSDPGALS